jgi:hypothetical protein
LSEFDRATMRNEGVFLFHPSMLSVNVSIAIRTYHL